MRKIDTKKIIAKILQSQLSKEELEDLKKSLDSDPVLRESFKKEIGFFMALKSMDDLELEEVIEKHKFKPPPEREIER